MVERVSRRLIRLMEMNISIVTDSVGKQIMVAVSMIETRFAYYKAVHVVPKTKELQFHWAFMAFGQNLQRCVEIICLIREINKIVEACTSHDSMLSPVAYGAYAKAHESSDNRDMQGLFLYYDRQRSSICHADVVYGCDKEDKSKSKRPVAGKGSS